MPNPPPVTILLDPRDDAAVTRTALATHNPLTGRLTIHPTPATTSTHALADDLLHALGTPHPGPNNPHRRRSTDLWDTVTSQITRQRISHLIILRAHLMTRPRWSRLLDLREHTAIQLTLICHGHAMPAAGLDALRDLPHHITTDIGALPAQTPNNTPRNHTRPAPPARPCCPVCGRTPHTAAVGRPPTYCSPRCRKLAHKIHTTARDTATTAEQQRDQLTAAHTDLARAITALTHTTTTTAKPDPPADAFRHATDIAHHADRIARLARDHAQTYTEHRNAISLAAALTPNRPPPPPNPTDSACRFH